MNSHILDIDDIKQDRSLVHALLQLSLQVELNFGIRMTPLKSEQSFIRLLDFAYHCDNKQVLNALSRFIDEVDFELLRNCLDSGVNIDATFATSNSREKRYVYNKSVVKIGRSREVVDHSKEFKWLVYRGVNSATVH